MENKYFSFYVIIFILQEKPFLKVHSHGMEFKSLDKRDRVKEKMKKLNQLVGRHFTCLVAENELCNFI